MKKHNACISTHEGWVEIDNETKKVINCVKIKLHDKILESKFYKNKEGIYWLKVKKINNYESNLGKCIAYYDTEYINHIVRYPEFTGQQFKDSLLLMCDASAYSKNNGYFLRTHIWNIVYVKGNPCIIDIRDFMIYLKENDFKYMFLDCFKKELDNHCVIHASKFVENYDEIYNLLDSVDNDLLKIRKVIEKIIVKKTDKKNWSDYHNGRTNYLMNVRHIDENLYNKVRTQVGGLDDPQKSIGLFTLIEDIESEIKTVIEIGCNNGLYCFGLSYKFNVVGIDYDEYSIDFANKINKNLRANCTFLCCNILDEENNDKAYGLNGSYDNLYTRLKSDCLIAPAVVHHLYKSCKSTDKIIRIFNNFSTKYMIIESIPDICKEEKLKESLIKYNWQIIKNVKSVPHPRNWMLCKKI